MTMVNSKLLLSAACAAALSFCTLASPCRAVSETGGVSVASCARGKAASSNCADVTWRVPSSGWLDQTAFDELSGFFVSNSITGKFALFTSDLHSPLKLQKLLELAKMLKGRIAALHAMGYRAGINHLVTLGHFDECPSSSEYVEGANRFTLLDGSHGIVQYCSADKLWRERYIDPCYRALADTGADFIWTDDDIRLRNRGAGCFCDACLARIRSRLGYGGPREGLEEWLSDAVHGKSRRLAFLQYNRDTLADLYAFIEKSIHAVSPTMDIGVMDVSRPATACWHGMPYREVFAALSTPKSEVYWRPGGGLYKDDVPSALLYKANVLAEQAAILPPGVSRIEAELENFPYQRPDKSEHFAALEGLLYVALGMNGVAYNVFSSVAENEELDAYLPLVRRLEENFRTYEWIVAAAGRTQCRGIWAGNGERDVYAGVAGRPWLNLKSVDAPFPCSEVQMSGMPIAYRFEDGQVFAPMPEVIRILPDDRIERMLSGGIYLDIPSLVALVERGYGADVGFAPGNPILSCVRERFLEHPLNAGLVGRIRNARQQFFARSSPFSTAHELKPQPGAEILSVYVDEKGTPIPGSCAMGVFVNRRGGRVCVNGYSPWAKTSFRGKRAQLRRVFQWLSKDTLPVAIADLGRVAFWLRGDRLAIVFNMSLDAARDVRLDLCGVPDKGYLKVPPYASEMPVSGVTNGNRVCFRIPEIPPWSLAFVRFLPMAAGR